MSCYTHLTIEERESILIGKSQGKGIREIARMIGRNPSTISRELKRNTGVKKRYSPNTAQSRYRKRRRRCHRTYKLAQPELRKVVRWMLVHLWCSPEQVAHRLRVENYPYSVSASTIYRGLYNGNLSDTIRQQFRRSKELGKRKGPGKGGDHRTYHRSIHERPQVANERWEQGHLEGDTVFVRNQNAVILTLIDRNSRMLYTSLLPGRDAMTTKMAMKEMLSALPANLRKTITLDRGSEFALIPDLEEELGIECYFCDPASPRQRGSNENVNGLLRQFFPRHSITFSPHHELSRFTSLLNLRPRKCLNWKTPFELSSGFLLHFT
jgi:Transposase and inactivated derivatives, IS30 family